MKKLFATMPQIGQVDWISIRSKRRTEPEVLDQVTVSKEEGLVGDHYSGTSGKRQVTLIQAEHIDTVAAVMKMEKLDPALLRRNIVVSGINLLALKNQQFQIGAEVLLEMTGLCHPCSRMEENLGPGGYNAMRGHGGITARVIRGGNIKVGDTVRMLTTIKKEA